MKQKERILNDVRDVLRYYDCGKYTQVEAVEQIQSLTEGECHNCVYNNGNGCDAPVGTFCDDGFLAYIESEAE